MPNNAIYNGNGALMNTAGSLTPGLFTDLFGGGKITFEMLASAGSQASGVFHSRSNGATGNRPILSITAVPEPGRVLLLLLGVVAMLLPRGRIASSSCPSCRS